jgi:hypothetical protein
MWAVSDDALLAGLATGDSDAAAAFVQRFQRRVYGLAVTIVGDSRAWRPATPTRPLRSSNGSSGASSGWQ